MWNSTPSHTDVVSEFAHTVSSEVTVPSPEHPGIQMAITARMATSPIAIKYPFMASSLEQVKELLQGFRSVHHNLLAGLLELVNLLYL